MTDANQRWAVRAIALDGELNAKKEKIRKEMQAAERLHLRDLVHFTGKRNSQVQAQLERTQQQKQRLQQQLQDATRELKECCQELMYTQEDLVSVLKPEQMTPKQAKEFAKILLEENEPARETIVRLLNAIYGLSLKPWDLEPRPFPAKPDSVAATGLSARQAPLSPETIRLAAEFDHLRAKFIAIKSQFARLKAKQGEIYQDEMCED